MHTGSYHRNPEVFGAAADMFLPEQRRIAEMPGCCPVTHVNPPLYVFSQHQQSCSGQFLIVFLLKAVLASLLVKTNPRLLGEQIPMDPVPAAIDHFAIRFWRRLCTAGGPESSMSPTKSLERRQITVLFCDVVGWTSLAHRSIPRNSPTSSAPTGSAARRSSHATTALIAQYVGDGVVAYFGYPDAHEDAAERAIRAALDIIKKDDRPSPPVEVRIGIATGGVVIGDLLEDAASAASSEPSDRRSTISARRRAAQSGGSSSVARARRMPSSCRIRHNACAAACSSTRTSDVTSSKGSPIRCRRGACFAKAAPRAVFTRYVHRT